MLTHENRRLRAELDQITHLRQQINRLNAINGQLSDEIARLRWKTGQ